MNLDWISNPLAIYSTLAVGGCAALHLVVSTRIELRREQKRHMAENESLREAVAALDGRVRELGTKEQHDFPRPTVYTASSGLNALKRAEALRMYRQGSDRRTVSNTLGLKQAEVALLETVHRLLSSGVT